MSSHSISGYITSNEDECDTTQYLSVLSHDLTLEGMNITLTNEKIEETNKTELGSTEDGNPPFIFKVDNTNEIYGVQVAQDEDGNLQKYQIQYSENINGELVPMLETIQFLPLDYTEQLVPFEENVSVEVSQANESFVVNHEEFISQKEDFNVDHEGKKHVDMDEEGWTIQTTEEKSHNYQIKNEPEGLYDQSSILPTEVEKTVIVDAQHSIELTSVNTESEEIHDDIGMTDEGNHLMAIQHLEIGHCFDQEELYEETIEENHFEQLFLEEKHMIDSSHLMDSTKNTSQNEIYHILNNISINPENVYDQSGHSILKETADQYQTNILKKPSQKSLLKDFINSEQKIVYVQTLPEKENMKVMDIESFIKPNSRSLLKSNQQPQVLKQTDCIQAGTKNAQKVPCNRSSPRTKEARYSYRTKEAKQARMFMNFINSTTIPQVPERKERLPRKQQIKPLEHPDEDIVVKEMIVSANNFVEPVPAEERKFLPVTEYVELLDSGDESNSCNNKKKRKNNRKDELIEIEISDTDECDTNDLGTEKLRDIDNKKAGISKKRGRPPKYRSAQDKKDTYPNSPPKISRFDSDVESVTSTLKVIRMENQIKGDVENAVESSEIIDSVEHINKSSVNEESSKEYINLEHTMSNEKSSQTDLKSDHSQNFIESTLKKGFDYKFECEKCKSKFINRFLLSRHECITKFGSNFSCNICKQKFSNNISLSLHKKSHAKETSMLKPNSTKTPQSRIFPKKEATTSLKSAISSSRSSTILKTPLKIPVKQSLLLSKNPKTISSHKSARQPALVEEKPLIVSSKSVVVPKTGPVQPIKNNSENKPDTSKVGCYKMQIEGDVSKLPSVVVTPDKIPNSYTFKCETQCDKCSKHFDNNTSWFEHQVLNHGFKTPDKSIGEKKQKKIVKDKVIHNGIRAAPTVAKNFSMLRNKVQHI